MPLCVLVGAEKKIQIMKELREVRKQMLTQMEQKLHETWSSVEDRMF